MSDVAASFDVGSSTLIQAYLTTSVSASTGLTALSIGEPSSSTSATALSVLGGGTSNAAGDAGSFIILSGAGQASGATATTEALTTGKLTNVQQKVVQAVSAAGTAGLTTDWNANGTEPSVLAELRNYGWLKLTHKGHDAQTNSAEGTYVLTPVGAKIAARTGGGSVSSSASSSLSNAVLNGNTSTSSSSSTTAAETAQAQAAYSTEVSTAASLLSSLGVNVSL